MKRFNWPGESLFVMRAILTVGKMSGNKKGRPERDALSEAKRDPEKPEGLHHLLAGQLDGLVSLLLDDFRLAGMEHVIAVQFTRDLDGFPDVISENPARKDQNIELLTHQKTRWDTVFQAVFAAGLHI